MTPEDPRIIAKRIEAKTRLFEQLQAISEFQQWKEEYVEGHIKELERRVLDVDRTSPHWREIAADGIIAYQEAQRTYKILFELKLQEHKIARQTLKELERREV